MAWSELPKELLNLISQRFDVEIDLIRFRSICSNWRSSSIPTHHTNILPFKFPIPKIPFDPIDSINTSFCYLSKHNIFLIKPPQQQQEEQTSLRPWLIRVSQNSTGKTQLFHPLLLSGFSFDFPHVLDFNKFSVIHLGINFIMDEENFSNFSIYNQSYDDGDGDPMFPQKVVAVTSHEQKKPLVLGITFTDYGLESMVLFKYGDKNWNVIPEMSTNLGDMCLFKGQSYVVDKIGRTVSVGRDNLSVRLVAEPLVDGGGQRKFLVESEGDLLLADVYNCFYAGFPYDDPVRIDLFMLNEKEKKWVKLTSLGDRVLFLGECGSFCASASDLCGFKGDCVIFMETVLESLTNSPPQAFILHLDEDQLSPLSDYPEYANLFWPPPEWIVQS